MNLSQKYHLIFDYELVKSDYPRWVYKGESVTPLHINVTKGRTRKKREIISRKKMIIAKKASNIFSKIPTIKFVGITGSLAMMNAKKDSDIDLMIITKKGTLWTTRLVSYLVSWLLGLNLRNPKNKFEKDMLCINLWLDESDLIWNEDGRNIYTAHEIAQIVPLVNKNKIYEKFLYLNKWILDYWPHAVNIQSYKDTKLKEKNKTNYFISVHFISLLIEKLVFKIQYFYMNNKITREIVTPTRAIFHPNDWGKIVMGKLGIVD